MKQTAGKVFAREYFYRNYLSSFMTPRQLRSMNFLTLLGEDFRELELLHELEIPPYRVFSVERDATVYKKQQVANRADDAGAALYHGELSDFVHTHLRHHEIAAFNLDICGSYLKAVDPVMGELLMHVRGTPQAVIATYHSAARDRPQLMEGLKSLVVLLWLAPEVVDRLARHLYGQYRCADLSDCNRNRDEISRNMLLRHMFWLRSHMEHVMVGAYTQGVADPVRVSAAFREQELVWKRFIEAEVPFVYSEVVAYVNALPRPDVLDVRMDLDFGDVELLTYAANDGFYHNCYFATFESTGSSVPLGVWLTDATSSLRRNRVVLIDAAGLPYETSFGRRAVDTDRVVLWDKRDLIVDLRQIVLPPLEAYEASSETQALMECPLEESSIEVIRRMARDNRQMTAREISQRLSLKLPLRQIAAYMAVARRRS